MDEHLVVGLSAILLLGVGAQWLAWRLHLPSILLLLVVGFLAGPVTGCIDPDHLFGDMLFPMVGLSVAAGDKQLLNLWVQGHLAGWARVVHWAVPPLVFQHIAKAQVTDAV